MKKKIRFFVHSDGAWYADLPDYIEAGGDFEDCVMVAGADTWLDFISGYADHVTLEISDTEKLSEVLYRKYKEDSSDFDVDAGADYVALEFKDREILHNLWLCPVTKFVFGDYPDQIHYRVVSNSIR